MRRGWVLQRVEGGWGEVTRSAQRTVISWLTLAQVGPGGRFVIEMFSIQELVSEMEELFLHGLGQTSSWFLNRMVCWSSGQSWDLRRVHKIHVVMADRRDFVWLYCSSLLSAILGSDILCSWNLWCWRVLSKICGACVLSIIAWNGVV